MKRTICFNIINICEKGGEERACTMLANSLAKFGYEIHIVSFYANNGLTPFYIISDKVKRYNLLPNINERRIHQYFGWLGYAQWKYKRYIRKHKINLIIDVATVRTPFTAPIAMELGIKHIAWDHFCYEYFISHPYYHKVLSCIQNDVDKLVVLTDRALQDYVNRANVLMDKIVRIYNCSPIEELCLTPHNSKRVLAMGRLHEQKGFDLLLQAWKYVEDANMEWRLEIVGDGPERDNLLDLIEELQLKRVTISPSTNNPRSKYEEASIYVLPSRIEGLGLVLLEAANMSLPIVAFACNDGPLELLEDGKNGFLIPTGDTKSMAERLILLMNSEELRKTLGTNAFNSVKNIRNHDILNQWIELIENT